MSTKITTAAHSHEREEPVLLLDRTVSQEVEVTESEDPEELNNAAQDLLHR